MALRLLSADRWMLQFGYYDEGDEFIELLQPLTRLEKDLIPKGLSKGHAQIPLLFQIIHPDRIRRLS
jgi:hypothetical protein